MRRILGSRTALVALVLAVAMGGGATALAQRTEGPSEETLAGTLRAGIAAGQNSFVTPEAVSLGKDLKPGHLDIIPGQIAKDPSKAKLDSKVNEGSDELAKYFTGKALADQVSTQNRWIKAQQPETSDRDPHFRPLGGGVASVDITSLTSDGDTASVIANVTVWAAMAQIAEDEKSAELHRPSNDIVATAKFVKRGESWLIDEYDWEFAPGSGP